MKLSIALLFAIILISCNKKNIEFNIYSSNPNTDTLDLKFKFDSFENKIKNNLLSKVDTTDLWKTLESISDTAFINNWNKQSMNFFTDYFGKEINELNQPNQVRNKNLDAIHFSILDKDYFEIEISNEQLLFSKNKAQIKSKPISKELLKLANKSCKCAENDHLNYILMNSYGNPIYRLDIIKNKDYKFCWKSLGNQDILNQLIKETE